MTRDRLRWAQRIQALAQTGLTYAHDPFDIQRYTELQEIAAEMVAAHVDATADAIVDLFRFERGYATPKVGVRALIRDDSGRVLLVQERSDGLWCPPGGWADVGTSPAAMAAREAQEETGYTVQVERLLAVLDRDVQGHPPIGWHVYNLIFLCRIVGGDKRTPDAEIAAVDWFAIDALPPLSLERVTHAQLERFMALAADPIAPVWFD